jgi:hypothetical protein
MTGCRGQRPECGTTGHRCRSALRHVSPRVKGAAAPVEKVPAGTTGLRFATRVLSPRVQRTAAHAGKSPLAGTGPRFLATLVFPLRVERLPPRRHRGALSEGRPTPAPRPPWSSLRGSTDARRAATLVLSPRVDGRPPRRGHPVSRSEAIARAGQRVPTARLASPGPIRRAAAAVWSRGGDDWQQHVGRMVRVVHDRLVGLA